MSNETRVFLLTGCSRGIGLAIAHYLLKRNPINKVFGIARSAGPLAELKAQYPGQVEFIVADLADLRVGSLLSPIPPPRAVQEILTPPPGRRASSETVPR